MTGKMKLQIVGNCPDCGAPIYGAKSCEGEKVPKVTYSCECRRSRHGTCDLVYRYIIEKEYVPQPYPIYVERPTYVPVPTYPTGPLYPTWTLDAPYTTCGSGGTTIDTSDTCIMGTGGHDAIWARQ